MKTRWLAAFLTLTLPGWPEAAPEMTVAEVVKKVRPAVVTVLAYDRAGGLDKQGTGFLTESDRVVTSYHVVAGAASAKVKTASGKVHSVRNLAGADEVADVAILRLETRLKGAKKLTLAKSLPEVGEKVVVVGSPLGLELSVSDGIVSALRAVPGMGKIIQITAPISPGSSGSPVVNMDGTAVGIARSIVGEGQNLNFATASICFLTLGTGPNAHLALPTDGTSGAARDRGLALFAQCAYDKALPYLVAATKTDPGDWLSWLRLGICYDELKEYTEAEEALKRAVRISPETDEVHSTLGAVYERQGRYPEAIEANKQAIHLDPYNAIAHYNLGCVYGRLGKHSEAIGATKQAIRLDPEFAAAHFNLGVSLERLGRISEAVAAYTLVVALDPDDADAHAAMGEDLGRLGQLDASIAAYKQAVRIKPDAFIWLTNLASAYGKGGRWAEMEPVLKQAIRANPDYAHAHLGLGMLYLKTGKRDLALGEYTILQKLDQSMANALFDLIYE